MIRHLKILALILPLLVPVLLIGNIIWVRHQALIYPVKIEGYDPRDLLYGHYLMFRYAPEKSAAKATFPAEMKDILAGLPTRYYLDERYALEAERLLRNTSVTAEIEVGVPSRGKPFIGDLLIDGTPLYKTVRQPSDFPQ